MATDRGVCVLLTVTARVEVLLDLVQAALQHRALLRGQALLPLLQIVLAEEIFCIFVRKRIYAAVL